MARPRRNPEPKCEHKVTWRSEPVTMPWGPNGQDGNEIIERIRGIAHPMLVVEIEAPSYAGIMRRIAEINDETRPYGWSLDYPDDVLRCECCGQPIPEGC